MTTDMATETSDTARIGAIRPPSARRRALWANVASYVVLALFAIAFIGPLLMLVFTSFKTLPEFFRNPIGMPESFGVDNFVDAWSLASFPRFLLNSLIYTVAATSIMVFTSVFVAFPIARGYVKGAGALFTLYVIALFLPPALIPQFQLILNLGLFDTRQGFILLFITNPIAMIILVNYIKSIPRELDESAAVDGAGYFRFIVRVILPLIRPAVATVTVLHSIVVWNEIIAPTIYLTSSDLYPITRGLIVFEGVYGSDWPKLAAAVLMLAVPMIILYLFLQRFIISGLTAGSVKG